MPTMFLWFMKLFILKIKNFKKEEITSHFQTLQKCGYRIGKSQQTIYARLKEKIAHYLEVKETHSWADCLHSEDGTALNM